MSATDTGLTPAQVDAWCEKYASTPWNALALAVVVDDEPSPLRVLNAAVLNMHEATARAERLALAAEALLELKDGPRDEAYRLGKEGAWERLRAAVRAWREMAL